MIINDFYSKKTLIINSNLIYPLDLGGGVFFEMHEYVLNL
jgi:hypothetical protein